MVLPVLALSGLVGVVDSADTVGPEIAPSMVGTGNNRALAPVFLQEGDRKKVTCHDTSELVTLIRVHDTVFVSFLELVRFFLFA